MNKFRIMGVLLSGFLGGYLAYIGITTGEHLVKFAVIFATTTAFWLLGLLEGRRTK